MRIAVISDLHANFVALHALAADIAKADAIICLGDILGYYCEPRETIEWVQAHVNWCVRGNHDHYVLTGCPHGSPPAVRFGVEFASAHIGPTHKEWLSSLPLTKTLQLEGVSLLLVHGSPWDPLGGYLYEDNPRLNDLQTVGSEVVCFGHTHRFFLRNGHRYVHLNPGSVGQSRDKETVGFACAAIIDTENLSVTRIVRPYNVQNVLKLAYMNGAGPWIEKFLR